MLADYQNKLYTVPEYLDGRYFNLVMASLDPYCVAPTPLVVRFTESGKIHTNENVFVTQFPGLAEKVYARVVIEHLAKDGSPKSRHSNLLIVDDYSTRHFEPSAEYAKKYPGNVNDLRELVAEILSGTLESTVDDQMKLKPEHGGYCVAYVLKKAYFDKLGKQAPQDSLEDIRRFSRMVEFVHGGLPGTPDIEFGTDGQNTAIGGLAGAGLGYALLGPAGALLGGAGGAYLGSRQNQRRRNGRARSRDGDWY